MKIDKDKIAEMTLAPKNKPFFQSGWGFLSNGVVLLLIGSLITQALVPGFQRQYEY